MAFRMVRWTNISELALSNWPWLQAQDLGLHRDATLWQMNGKSMFTSQELQARKQIWWACVRADKCVELELSPCLCLISASDIRQYTWAGRQQSQSHILIPRRPR